MTEFKPPTKPKRGPPARLAAKMKKDDAGDVDMKNEEEKVPASAPALKQQPSNVYVAPVAATAKAKIPQGKDDETSEGLSKEEAEDKVKENFPPEITKKFEEAKW